MLILLKKGTARFQIHGMSFSTCGSSIGLFLWDRTAEWEIKTSRFLEKEKKRQCKRKRCRVKGERWRNCSEIGITGLLVALYSTHTRTHTHAQEHWCQHSTKKLTVRQYCLITCCFLIQAFCLSGWHQVLTGGGWRKCIYGG